MINVETIYVASVVIPSKTVQCAAEKCFVPIAHQIIPSVNVGMMIGVMIVFHRIMNANMMDVKGIL